MDANLVGGDISGGAMDIPPISFSPNSAGYATSAKEFISVRRRRRPEEEYMACAATMQQSSRYAAWKAFECKQRKELSKKTGRPREATIGICSPQCASDGAIRIKTALHLWSAAVCPQTQ